MTTETDIATVRAFMERRDRQRQDRVTERVRMLRTAAPDLARMLVDGFGATRVWLFGSLAWGEPDEHCDLDLAVQGLASSDYFTALGAVLAAAPSPVDLVRMEEAPDALAHRIRQHGVVLHA